MGRVWTSQTVITPPPRVLDPTTVAWVNAVVANGGSVNTAESLAADDLIVGLKADSLFTIFDRLWLFALHSTSINEPSALTDIIANSLATNVNSTPLTVGGYTGNGSTMYIDTNFNVTTAPSPKFTQTDACIFCWHNTAGQDGDILGTVTGAINQLNPRFTDNNMYWTINGAQHNPANATDSAGLYTLIRTNAPNAHVDVNGVQFNSSTATSSPPTNSNFTFLRAAATFSTRQACAGGFGASLTAGQSTNLYNRFRTYMTAVGVP